MGRLKRYYGVSERYFKRKKIIGSIKTHRIARTLAIRDKLDTRNSDSYVPLHFASYFANYKSMWILLCSGANINRQCQYRKTPLHYASDTYLHSTWILLVCGADRFITNKWNRKPIDSTHKDEIKDFLFQD